MLVVFTTTSNKEEAESLARKLVKEKLAGCVQIVPQITSFYFWDNQVQKDEECLLLIKTLPGVFDKLEQFIKKNHIYSTPEIVAVNSSDVSAEYLSWLESVIS